MAIIELYEDRILIKVDTPKDIGIIIPDSEKLLQGVVVNIGPGKTGSDFLPIRTKVGDHVRYGGYGTQPFSIDGEEFILTTEEYIIGKI